MQSAASPGAAERPKSALETGIMQGSPPPSECRVTHDNWDRPPFNRWSFQHVREVLPTVPVGRGSGPARDLERAEQDLGALGFETADGRGVTLSDFLDETYTDGLIVLHRGAVVFERYFNGMAAGTPHLSQSVAKSVAGTVAGILIGRGVLDPHAPVEEHVPEFADCGYRGATLSQVMDMRSGVKFSEVYTDPQSDIGKVDIASGWKPRLNASDPEHMFEVILGLTQERDHGGRFEYRSIETDVMAFCMERVTGQRLAELVDTELWSRLGAEEDAYFTVDPAGYALADGGFNATLRDYARFGQMHLDRGAVDGDQIVPRDWVAACSRGDPSVFGAPYTDVLPNGAYAQQFWVEDANTQAYMARGVFGQLIHIDPDNDMVTVKLSTWPDFQNTEFGVNTLRAIHAIARELNGGA